LFYSEKKVANHKSAEKRARQTVRRTERNSALKSKVKSAVKIFREAVSAGDKAKATTAFEAATRELRKAASKGIMHKRTASRRVSRLASAQHAAASK
jgi:small subunit ribosomal protein S20